MDEQFASIAKPTARSGTADSSAREVKSRQLGLVAAQLSSAVIVASASGQIEWVNDAFTRLTGYSLEEVRGKKPGPLLQGPETCATTSQKLRDAMALGQSLHCEILNYAKDGRKYWVAIELQPVRDADGNLTNFVAVERDVTLTKQDSKRRELVFTITRLLGAGGGVHEMIERLMASISSSLGCVAGR